MKRFLSLLILTLSANSYANSSYWYSFGDLRGYIEPCGCNPDTDLGGVQRIDNQIEKIKSRNPELMVFDLGNNLEVDAIDSTKSKFISKSLDIINPTASLLNEIELNAPSDSLGERKYLISNLKSKFNFINKVVFYKEYAIFGYVGGSKENERLIKIDKSLIADWQSLLKGKNIKQKFLLFSGTGNQLREISRYKFFDHIISSNTAEFSQTVDDRETRNIRTLLRDEKLEVYMVPLGGQGLLKGGDFPKEISLDTLISLDKSSTSKLNFDKSSFIAEGSSIVDWLRKDLVYKGKLDEVLSAYNKQLALQFELNSKKKLEELKHSKFVGATMCMQCHINQGKIWKDSQHAVAYETLKSKQKAFDSHCVQCHVVGLDQTGGFVSEELTPHLAGVQCENCHGPGKDHVSNPIKFKFNKVKEDTCKKCHHNPHTSHFEWDKYWPKIKH